jgi:hypothetical protein
LRPQAQRRALASGGIPERPTSTKGLKPKILDDSPPAGDEQSEEVRQHNKEMEDRADRACARVKNQDAPKDKGLPPKNADSSKKE